MKHTHSYRCVEGRKMRHDPQFDDPELETDVGSCEECDGKGCEASGTEKCTQVSDDEFLSVREQHMIDQAWENHKAALPVATVINDNQPGRTAIDTSFVDIPR